MEHEIGVGATPELSLRVSVAAVVRVLFESPADACTMAVLERTATLKKVEGRQTVKVVAKPFGGGVRLTGPQTLGALVGDFRYDSVRSRQEKDFRIQVRPDCWETLKEICIEHLDPASERILDLSPERELAEEFEDTLNVRLTRNHYRLQPDRLLAEDRPIQTQSVRATGRPTARMYYVFEAWIEAPDTISKILENDRLYTDLDLQGMALKDARDGGRGRANAVLVLPLDVLRDAYLSIPVRRRGEPIRVGDHQLDGNVLALLGGVEQTRYTVLS